MPAVIQASINFHAKKYNSEYALLKACPTMRLAPQMRTAVAILPSLRLLAVCFRRQKSVERQYSRRLSDFHKSSILPTAKER